MSQTYYEPFIQLGSPLAVAQLVRSRTIHITRKSTRGGTAHPITNHYQSFSSSLRPSKLRFSRPSFFASAPLKKTSKDNLKGDLKDVLKVWRLMNVVKKEPLAYTFYRHTQ
ncbi:Hypothetical_protein [Hexamita inflata]|uniref:Hypothetical_protein n=1 Tax=Hexamita inflata TaxID=28002 RepID=A0AA86TWA9_9EUKA|nr:Hypothetical protein HINF_LOCUS19155 [Hexamita inflata]